MADITKTKRLSNLEILTDSGWRDISHVHETVPYQVWQIRTPNYFLECADEHIVFDKSMNEVFVKDLKIGDLIITETGPEPITSVDVLNEIKPMYDLTVDHEDHRFFSNGILSHNSTMLTVFSLWMVCFHEDYRAAIVANKEITALNIFKRIRMAYEQLPNYIKPGVKDYGKSGMTLGNDSSIIVSTTTATSIRGDSLNCVAGDSWIKLLCDNEEHIRMIGDICHADFVPNTRGFKILTKSGWSTFAGFKRSLTSKEMYQIRTIDHEITCTEDHLIFINSESTETASNINVGDLILTDTGANQVTDIQKLGVVDDWVYDVIETQDHSFWANGICVHNCVLLDEAAHIDCMHGDSVINLKNGDLTASMTIREFCAQSNPSDIVSVGESSDVIEIIKNSEWKVETPTGWQSFKGVTKYHKKQMYDVSLESSKTVRVTAKHCFIDNDGHKIFCKDSLNKTIQTKHGLEQVVSITETEQDFAYDLTSVEGGSVFFANDIVNHNTHLLEDFWSSVIPTISSGSKSKILMVSTPNGVSNKFYQIYSGAESGKLKTWKAERIDWWDVPGRDEAWKQTQIELLGSEEKFLQEYNNTFLDDAAGAVGATVIERFKANKKDPVWTSEDGEYTVFEYPDKTRLYVIGVDVGEGIGRASSVAQILDVTDLQDVRQVAVYSSAVVEPYHFANKLSIIGQSWGLPPMLIERNNCGAQVIDALYYKNHYEKIVSYSKISEKDKYNSTRNLGVLSHNNIRFDGVQNMRYWVNHLQTVHINDPHTISEFETFVRFPNGIFRKKSDNFFDDRIMSLVWALFMLELELCQQYFEVVDIDNQNKPKQIKHNGYWNIDESMYELKQLDQNATIVPKIQPEAAFPALGVSAKELEQIDKYEADLDELFGMGYTFL
jgi:hypothetical protein